STALRLVVVQPDPAGPTVAFTIRQSAADYAQSQQPPEPRPIAGAAPYPDSVGTFFATDSQAGAAFAVTRADAAADDIQRFFHAELRAAGWRPLIVNRSAAQASRLAAYARGPELCFLLVTDSPPDRAATITLLHKRAGMK
ncbi:MAG: hypothetical protein O3B24_07475, partial [Verrucomicrobia bacterium]|nr:hypothetical protein [Verrucomicrobiota bacterium]